MTTAIIINDDNDISNSQTTNIYIYIFLQTLGSMFHQIMHQKNNISTTELLRGQKNSSAPQALNLLRAPGCLEENYIEMLMLIV